MKKLLCSLLILNLFAFAASAEDYDGEGTYTINLTCTKGPSYAIRMPKALNVADETTILTFYVKGDLYGDQRLNIVFDRNTTLSNNSSTVPVSISQAKSSWSHSELSDDYISSSVTITHTQLSAGNWNGRLGVTISLQGA